MLCSTRATYHRATTYTKPTSSTPLAARSNIRPLFPRIGVLLTRRLCGVYVGRLDYRPRRVPDRDPAAPHATASRSATWIRTVIPPRSSHAARLRGSSAAIVRAAPSARRCGGAEGPTPPPASIPGRRHVPKDTEALSDGR
jgi:hypothetical protein